MIEKWGYLCVAALFGLVACGESPNDSVSEETASKSAQQTQTEVAHYDAETFFATTSYSLAGGHAFSPDGAQLLISSDSTGVFNAYAMNVGDASLAPLTASNSNATFAVSYFPNDSRILFTADSGGNELNHLFVRKEDGSTQDLTPGEKVKATFISWLDDGSAFFVATNERDQKNFDLYRYNSEDYSRTLAFENDGFQLGDVSRNGAWLALDKPRTSADSNVYIVDLNSEDKTPKLITAHEGNIAYGTYEFTPSSSALIYATNEHGEFNQAWRYDLQSEEKSEYLSADWDVSYVTFSTTGRYMVAGINEDARTKLRIRDVQTGAPVILPDLPKGDIVSVRFNDDDSRMAFLLNGSTQPSNVYVMDVEGGEPKALTQALNPAINPDHLVDAQVVRYRSFDGLKIPGILYTPKTASADDPAPAIVWVHGGPGGQSRTGYNPTIQHLVNHGYVVLAANNRGSSGYGKTFFHMDDKRHGEVDLADIVHARKYLEGLDAVDGSKVAIMGGSYGGYMVAAALAFEPEAFDVGVNIFGVTNWVRTLKSIPPWWDAFREALYDELGDPATDEERLRRISPLFHASKITKPLLVVQGANDPRVLQVESDELVDAVKANGVPVEYIVFPDEGHGFRNRDNRIRASNAYVNFLDRYLKGAE